MDKREQTQINVWVETKELFLTAFEFKEATNFTSYMHQVAKAQIAIMKKRQGECSCKSKLNYGPSHDEDCSLWMPF